MISERDRTRMAISKWMRDTGACARKPVGDSRTRKALEYAKRKPYEGILSHGREVQL